MVGGVLHVVLPCVVVMSKPGILLRLTTVSESMREKVPQGVSNSILYVWGNP